MEVVENAWNACTAENLFSSEDLQNQRAHDVCDADGNMRGYMRWMAVLGVIGWPLFVVVTNETNGAADKLYHRPLWEDGQVNHLRLLDAIYGAGANFAHACSASFPAELANIIRLNDGTLARLGAGEKRFAARELKSLPRWRPILAVVGVPFILYGLGMLLLTFFAVVVGFMLLFTPYFREEWCDDYDERADDAILQAAG